MGINAAENPGTLYGFPDFQFRHYKQKLNKVHI
jgi:hypothetical protein